MDTHHQNEKLEVLATFTDFIEAEVLQVKLKAKGIDSFIHDENVVGLNPLGGFKIKVFSKDLAIAKSLNEGAN